MQQLDEPLRMPAPDVILLARPRELLERVLPQRLEHPVAPAVGAHKAPVDESFQRVKLGVADGLRGLKRAAAGEHRQPGEQPLLLLVEQPVAPVDRRLQRALAPRRVARPAGKHRQAALEPIEDLGRREDLGSGGGELDRERQPVEPLAHGGRSPRAR